MSGSSWTATDGGRRRGACRGLGRSPARGRSVTGEPFMRSHPTSAMKLSSPFTASPLKIGRVPSRRCPTSWGCSNASSARIWPSCIETGCGSSSSGSATRLAPDIRGLLLAEAEESDAPQRRIRSWSSPSTTAAVRRSPARMSAASRLSGPGPGDIEPAGVDGGPRSRPISTRPAFPILTSSSGPRVSSGLSNFLMWQTAYSPSSSSCRDIGPTSIATRWKAHWRPTNRANAASAASAPEDLGRKVKTAL